MAYSVQIRHGGARVLLMAGIALAAAPSAADPVSDGKAIATSGGQGVVACATCHGAQGQGMEAAGFPYLAGQGAAYLALQLQDFAKGSRHNAVMEPIAKALTAAQIEAVAAYYSQLPRSFDAKAISMQAQTYPDKDAMGAWLSNRGDWDNNIPACNQCHGPGGIGVGEHFPALAGLSSNYIQAQLNAWKQGQRPPGPLSLMGDIASRMSDVQITAVAGYFSSLPQSARKSSGASATESQGAK